ncbi:ABC transporter ATP-binding protein [Tissierella praeacuta]|uniref:ABC transporter ATP-binding protein n=1 Tax=Tissierella praeacuta TaxID=43131 RepID=UPI00333F98C8
MLLEVKDGTFYYDSKTPILENINFKMGPGETMAVMGRNGVGKTTLIKCIAGILKWKSGYSIVAGQKSNSNKPIGEIGYVPQAHKASFSYSVRDMVVFGKVGHNSYFAVPRNEDYQKADKILECIGIADLSDKRCNELSGGQLQLVFIARALVNSPQLLILDEPEAHLDFRNQLRLLKLIKNVVSEQNISCIINTHYPNHAIRIADKCFLLGDNDYQEGVVQEVMTDSNIKKYFSVRSQTLYTTYEGIQIPTFVFLDEV